MSPRRFAPPHSRRSFLAALGLGAAAGALAPFVPLLEGEARPGSFPRRLVLFHTPNGTIFDEWRCAGTEYDWSLSPMLAPLASRKQDVIVLDGVDNVAIYSGPGAGHSGIGTLWTGTELQEGDMHDVPSGWANGISVDQLIANRLEGQTPFKSLELGVRVTNNATVRSRMSYTGPAEPLSIDSDPFNVFDRLFADAELDPLALAEQREARLGVIAGVEAELETLGGKLSGADQHKLEQHLDNLRAIETRIENSVGLDCAIPSMPAELALNDPNYAAIGALQMDLLTAAFACDLTRVASIMWCREAGGPVFSGFGHVDNAHWLSHRKEEPYMSQRRQIHTFYAEQFVALLDRLAAVPEGDGSMLDNTVVVWASAICESTAHGSRNIPVVLGGRCGGYFETGRYLRYGSFTGSPKHAEHGGRTNNDLLITLCHAMGQTDVETFGNPGYCTGPLL